MQIQTIINVEVSAAYVQRCIEALWVMWKGSWVSYKNKIKLVLNTRLTTVNTFIHLAMQCNS